MHWTQRGRSRHLSAVQARPDRSTHSTTATALPGPTQRLSYGYFSPEGVHSSGRVRSPYRQLQSLVLLSRSGSSLSAASFRVEPFPECLYHCCVLVELYLSRLINLLLPPHLSRPCMSVMTERSDQRHDSAWS